MTSDPLSLAKPEQYGELPQLANLNNADRLNRRLGANQAAMNWLLRVRGYSIEIIEEFKLGLSAPYNNKSDGSTIHANALSAPLRSMDGRFRKKYVNYAIPGLTVDARETALKVWSAGDPQAYYSRAARPGDKLFVCDGLEDLWALCTLLRGTKLEHDLLLASSTNEGGALPAEWKSTAFWAQWTEVFLGHDNDKPNPRTLLKAGDQHALVIAASCGREVRRVWPPGKDWNDFLRAGGTPKKLESLLAASRVLDLQDIHTSDHGGFKSAEPVDLTCAFVNGFLYQSMRVLRQQTDEITGEQLESYTVVVVRSDRTLHDAKVSKSPPGTARGHLVHRLHPDGALINKPPAPSVSGTWRWPSVQRFLDGTAPRRSLKELIVAVAAYLKCQVWLPAQDDYALLACAVAATYCQQIFDSVPLLLATGPAGSGKTQLGIAMTRVCANSLPPIGLVSAATIARTIDASRGFCALDDLEGIGSKEQSDDFSNLIQALKLSYNKLTATKNWTDVNKGMEVKELNFYGIKLINNTSGVDRILGTRMLKIYTRHMPAGVQLIKDGQLDDAGCAELRDDLHEWAFSATDRLASSYATTYPNKTNRADEIAAPLRVVAQLSESTELREALDRALRAQEKLGAELSSDDLLREALFAIVADRAREDGLLISVVTVVELQMRLRSMADQNFGASTKDDIPEIESPEWIGRALKGAFAEPGASPARLNLHGQGTRAWKLSPDTTSAALKESGLEATQLTASNDARVFCKVCKSCLYRGSCPIERRRAG